VTRLKAWDKEKNNSRIESFGLADLPLWKHCDFVLKRTFVFSNGKIDGLLEHDEAVDGNDTEQAARENH
jgi:hypothetical protein